MSQFIIDKSKENSEGELIIFLFELCNLSCQMCYQDHNSRIGMDKIVEKIDVISKTIDGLVARGKRSVSINLMGGELFADQIEDSIFDDYATLIYGVRSYCEKINIPIEFQIATNLVWENTDRVRKFLDTVNIPIAVSWDPVGRFNSAALTIFKQNIVAFKDYVTQVGVVMTAPTIREFMKGTPELFDYIYDNFVVVFDHYTPDNNPKHIDHLLPTDVMLRDFYKFMIDHWPKCHPFKETLSDTTQPMFCMGTVNVLPNSSISSCQQYEVKEVVVHFGSLNKHKEQWFEDYDCLSCEYMQKCSFGCFLNNHNKKSRTQKECWLKEVYDYVEIKNNG